MNATQASSGGKSVYDNPFIFQTELNVSSRFKHSLHDAPVGILSLESKLAAKISL